MPSTEATHSAPSDQAAESTVDDLTHQNVKSIAALEATAKISTGWGERLAMQIAGFCGSMLFIYLV